MLKKSQNPTDKKEKTRARYIKITVFLRLLEY